jgi:hypothetical protein
MTLAVQSRQGHQIGGEHAPADPLLEPFEPMAWTTGQLHRALDDADPSFDPVPETLAPLEPGLFLTALTAPVPIAGFRQHNMFDPHLTRQRLVLR